MTVKRNSSDGTTTEVLSGTMMETPSTQTEAQTQSFTTQTAPPLHALVRDFSETNGDIDCLLASTVTETETEITIWISVLLVERMLMESSVQL